MKTDLMTLEDILTSAKLLFDEGFDGILITEPDINNPIIRYVNPAHCKMTGYLASEVLGHSPKIFQGPKTKTSVLDKLKNNLLNGQNFHGSAINYRKNGSEYHVEWKINRVLNKNNEVVCFISVQRDLTFIKAFLSRLKSTTDVFRELLDSVIHSDKTGREMSHDKIVKRATDEEVRNMSLFSKDLISSTENIELFDDELFLFGECNMGVMPIKNKQTTISAQTFHRYSSIDPDDVQNLCSFIEECMLNIELLEVGSARQTSFVEILINFQEIANCIFFMDEFIDISTVLGQLAATLDKYHVDDLEEFVIDTLRGITTDLHRWITDVFITKVSTNIHELEPSIIGSSKQLIFMLKQE